MTLDDIILTERPDKRSETKHTIAYDRLYHLTDYEGFSNAVGSNAINARRQDFVSTTYDVSARGILGRNHYDFKFILDAKKLASDYGVFRNQAFVRVSDRYERLEEREYGVDTRAIKPLTDYASGLVFLVSPFERRFIQWMFYRNYNSQGRGVNALKRWVYGFKKPILVQETEGPPRPLTDAEREIVMFMLRLGSKGNLSYPRAFEIIADKFDVIGSTGEIIDGDRVRREKQARIVADLINRTLTSREWRKLKPDQVRRVIDKAIRAMGYGDNFRTVIMHEIESRDLFDPGVRPVEWSWLLRDLVDGNDIEDIVWGLDRIKEDRERRRRFEDEPYAMKMHDKTMVAGIGDGY